MMSKFGIFSIILFSSFWTLTAQSNYSIQGKIIDADYKPIDLATVSLSEEQADSIFTSDYTDLDGSFELSKVPEGRYILQVFLRGYEPLSRNLIIAGQQQQINIDDIVLMSDLHLLEQVTVTAKIPFVERKIDRMVVNTDAILAAASLNVLEILELAPGVTLDQNESIRLKGRSGVAVFIDNKPSYLSGQELANYLKSLPASTIKQIE